MIFQKLKIYLNLAIKSPKNFLYSFVYSARVPPVFKPFNPRTRDAAAEILSRIKANAPDLKVHFIGASSLGILGQGDIDLLAESSPDLFSKYSAPINSLFGKPAKIRSRFIEWKFRYEDFDVELCLVDPSLTTFKERLQVYEILKKDQQALTEYENLKLRCQQMSIREYERSKMNFFNRILGL